MTVNACDHRTEKSGFSNPNPNPTPDLDLDLDLKNGFGFLLKSASNPTKLFLS
jgi:hypothetical protein